MPRKLNKIPSEVMPSEGSRGIKENPANEPSTRISELKKVHERASKAEELRAQGAEKALRSQAENEDLVSVEALNQVRATLRFEDIAAASKDDKILEYAAAKNKQDTIIKKAEAVGLTSTQFLQMLDNGPLDDQPERFGNVKNFFRRLAGQTWAGKDASKLNKLMEEYLAAETIVNAPAQKNLENLQASPRSRPSIGGGRMVSRSDAGERPAAVATPEARTSVEDESNPAGTANLLLEKYNVTIGKGRTLVKDGKLTYENQGAEELSIADLVKNQTLLSQAYNQILSKNKKDAKALVEAVAEIRYTNNDSALATQDIAAGRAVAAGRKQADVGMGSMKVAGRGAGSSGLDNGLNEILQSYDTKRAKAEFAEEAAVEKEWSQAISKAKKQSETVEATEAKQQAEVAARDEESYKIDTIQRTEAVNAEFKQKQEQIDREVRWLAAFSKADAKQTFKLMVPDAPVARLNLVTGNTIADTYRAMLTEEANYESRLKRKAPGVNKDTLKKLKANLDAVRAFAANVTVELSDEDIEVLSHETPKKSTREQEMAAVRKQGEANAKNFEARRAAALAEQDRLEAIDRQEAAEIAHATAAKEAKAKKLERSMAEVSAAGRKNMQRIAEEDAAPFLSDEDVELIEDEAAAPTKASEADITAFAKAMNERSGKKPAAKKAKKR